MKRYFHKLSDKKIDTLIAKKENHRLFKRTL